MQIAARLKILVHNVLTDIVATPVVVALVSILEINKWKNKFYLFYKDMITCFWHLSSIFLQKGNHQVALEPRPSRML